MHLHRETVLSSALVTVLSQIKPPAQRPLEGDLDEIRETVQPMMEIVLNLGFQIWLMLWMCFVD